MTVVLTTSSPLDAARCDKVAVLAAGGHLAFFGTPAAARGYFGADSLEEIYERLAGLGDPAAAWSRRFFHFSRTRAGFTARAHHSARPGPAVLVPDAAGPHSAGPRRPDLPRRPAAGRRHRPWTRQARTRRRRGIPAPLGRAALARRGSAAAAPAAARSCAVLIRRNAEVLAPRPAHAGRPGRRARRVLLAFCVLLGAARSTGRAAVTLAWAVLGGLAAGLAYELPAAGTEAGVLRGERFSGLSTAAFAWPRPRSCCPLLALADALILAVPAIAAGCRPGSPRRTWPC